MNVMRYEYFVLDHFVDFPSHFGEGRRLFHHGVRDAGKPGNVAGDKLLRIDQRFIAFDDLFAVMNENGYFRDFMLPGKSAGGLYVYDGIHRTNF